MKIIERDEFFHRDRFAWQIFMTYNQFITDVRDDTLYPVKVIRTEHMAEDLKSFCEEEEICPCPYRPKNPSHTPSDSKGFWTAELIWALKLVKTVDVYNEDGKKIVHKLFERDLQRFNYDFPEGNS